MSAASSDNRTAWIMWVSVAAAFLLLGLGWVILFKAANAAHIESVPLVHQGGKP